MKQGSSLERATLRKGLEPPFSKWGSIPHEDKRGSCDTIKCSACRGVAQPGSAPALGAGGLRFKSGRPDQKYLPSFLPLIKNVLHLKLHCGILAGRSACSQIIWRGQFREGSFAGVRGKYGRPLHIFRLKMIPSFVPVPRHAKQPGNVVLCDLLRGSEKLSVGARRGFVE